MACQAWISEDTSGCFDIRKKKVVSMQVTSGEVCMTAEDAKEAGQISI